MLVGILYIDLALCYLGKVLLKPKKQNAANASILHKVLWIDEYQDWHSNC